MQLRYGLRFVDALPVVAVGIKTRTAFRNDD